MTTTTRVRTALAAALIGVVTLAACGTNTSSNTGHTGMPMGSASPTSPAASASPSSSSTQFNAGDVMFAQMMIPHHQQAIQMSDMILAKSGVNPKVTSLAQQIKAAQQPEIEKMTGWLTAWGQPTTDPMGGMAMNGEMSSQEMAKLDAANGTTGQTLFLQGMIKHHQGAIQMARNEINVGKNPDAIALARKIAADQQQEITTMQGLLKQI